MSRCRDDASCCGWTASSAGKVSHHGEPAHLCSEPAPRVGQDSLWLCSLGALRVYGGPSPLVCGGATLVALPTTLLGGCRCSICRAGSSLAARRPHCAPAVPGSSCVRCPCVVVEPPTSCRGTRRSRCARRINARLGARPAFTGGGGEQQLLGTCPKTRRRTCVCGCHWVAASSWGSCVS